ncbi:MAG: hypothetical protein D3924_10660 [Candidatus Electrothrix sp. AR4]|nr:hypothetical protein [Candidatus Electrothrix sp. AR4]
MYTDKSKNSLLHEKKIVSISARIDLKAKIKLQVISSLFGKRQTPLLGEIIETSINEIFDQVELTEDLQEKFQIKMEEAGFHTNPIKQEK